MKSYHFEVIDSTSSYLKTNYDKYEDKTFVSASFQNKGHGRYNRDWISKKGENLLFSILIKDTNIINKFDRLSIASAVSVYKVLKELNINNVSIKWPNDVYVNDKKICGILLESVSFLNKIEALVVGVGLNVNSNEFININATSLYKETNLIFDIEDIKKKVYQKFNEMLNEIKNDDVSYLVIARNNNYLLNKKVYAKVNNEEILVEVIDIADDNSLIVKNKEKIYNLYSGEVTFNISE